MGRRRGETKRTMGKGKGRKHKGDQGGGTGVGWNVRREVKEGKMKWDDKEWRRTAKEGLTGDEGEES